MKILVLLFCLTGSVAHALTDQGLSVGAGFYSENILSEIAQSASGERSFLGSTQFPLILSYELELMSGSAMSFFLIPRLSYTLLARTENGNTADITNLQILLPVGWNIYNSGWDFSSGFGIHRRTVQGRGGIAQLSNGNGTSPFALPGRASTSQVMVFMLGTSYNIDRHGIGFDIFSEGMFSDKRTLSMMMSYSYRFQLGSGGGSSSSDFEY